MKQLLKMKKKGWISIGLVGAIIIAFIMSPLSGAHASGYDYQKAAEYADTWGGSKRNPDYYSYSGADCANYVSQCLRAGGVELGNDWKPYTLAWIQVPAMVQTFKARGYQVIENPTADQIYPGNPVIYQWKGSSYEWSHATICVGYDENGTPIVNGHTSDRYHVKWNYAVGSANKMCTILINNGSAELGNVVDLGNEFYAYINSSLADKPLTNDGSNVCLRSKGSSDEEIRSQVWKFVRLEDGSYVIYSTKDNNVLDVAGAETTPGTNVQTCTYWANPAQKWYIYENNGEYRLKSQCSACLLDVANARTTDGTNIQMCGNNGNKAQIFQIEKVNAPGVTNVYCTPGSDNITTISWDKTADTTMYNVRINGDLQKDVWNVTGTSCQVELPAGNYEVYVDACNAFSYSKSTTVKFTVPDTVSDAIENIENIDIETTVDEENTNGVEEIEPSDNTAETIENTEEQEDVEDQENTEDQESVGDQENTEDQENAETQEDIEDVLENVEGEEQNVQVNVSNNFDYSVTNIWNYIFNMNIPNHANETTETVAEASTATVTETATDISEDNRVAEYEFDEYGGTDNDAWSRNYAAQQYEQGTLDGQSPLTIVSDNRETMEEIQCTESLTDNSIYTKEETAASESAEEVGIRIVEEKNENGELQGVFLRIVFPYNGENQVLTIRLM